MTTRNLLRVIGVQLMVALVMMCGGRTEAFVSHRQALFPMRKSLSTRVVSSSLEEPATTEAASQELSYADRPRRRFNTSPDAKPKSRGTPSSPSVGKPRGRQRKSEISRLSLYDLFDPKKRTVGLSKIADNRVLTSVLTSWARSRETDGADRCMAVLQHIRMLGDECHLSVNVFACNVVISAYAQRKQPKNAEFVLKEMLHWGVKPDIISFTTVMSALAKSEEQDAPEKCEKLLADMIELSSSPGNEKLAPDIVTYTTIINAFAFRGRAEEAEKLLRDVMNKPGVELNPSPFNSVMNAWSNSNAKDAPEQCKRIMEEMKEIASSRGDDRFIPDVVSYTTVITAYAKRGMAKEAEDVLREMINGSKLARPNILTFGSVLNAWSRSPDDDAPEQCKRILTDMIQLSSSSEDYKKLAPNSFSYNSVIGAFAKRGRAIEAETILREMLEDPNVVPDSFTYSSVMNAWAKSDAEDAPEQCTRLLNEMKERAASNTTKHGKKSGPDIVSYTTIIDAYGSRGRVKEAEDILKEMLQGPGTKPNIRTYNTVMGAWAKSDTPDAPEQILRMLTEMQEEAAIVLEQTGKTVFAPNVVVYHTLMDAYMYRGRAKEAEEVLRKIVAAEDMKPDKFTYYRAIGAWCNSDASDATDQCLRLLTEMNQRDFGDGDTNKSLESMVKTSLRSKFSEAGREAELAEHLLD